MSEVREAGRPGVTEGLTSRIGDSSWAIERSQKDPSRQCKHKRAATHLARQYERGRHARRGGIVGAINSPVYSYLQYCKRSEQIRILPHCLPATCCETYEPTNQPFASTSCWTFTMVDRVSVSQRKRLFDICGFSLETLFINRKVK